jgi:hypothetical protein
MTDTPKKFTKNDVRSHPNPNCLWVRLTAYEQQQARIVQLEAALDKIQGLCPTSPQDNPTPKLGGFYGSQLQTVGNLTRAALKAKP